MKNKPIIIVSGDPDSIFIEIFVKAIKKKKNRSSLLLICCKNNLNYQLKKLNFDIGINEININNLEIKKLRNNCLNLIHVKLETSNLISLNDKYLRNYLKKSFDIAFRLIKIGFSNKLINGPINKKKFLNKKYLGITEYVSSKFKVKKYAMLIYNEKMSVSPVTTHLPISLVAKNINSKIIIEKIKIVDNFYKNFLKKKPKIAITGLNPHCESVLPFNEDEEIIKKSIKFSIKNNIDVEGPFPADTIFLKKNRIKFDVIIGMYHDQILPPIKTLYEYDAINITIGLPFLRVTPDHGPNNQMFLKNRSNPLSIFRALEFLDQF